MMQAFRNAAKPLMVVVAITFFAWLVLDLSGITGGTGLLTQTSVGKVNGQSVDARTYQNIVQQSIDARQRQTPGTMGLEDYQQVRDEVWDQIVQSNVLNAEYRRRGINVYLGTAMACAASRGEMSSRAARSHTASAAASIWLRSR